MDVAPRLPPVALADGVSILDRLGPGFTLLRVGPSAPSGAALIGAASVRAIPLDVLELDPVTVGDAFDDLPLILVRPDRRIVWRSRVNPSPDQAAAVLDQAPGRSWTSAGALPRVTVGSSG